MTTPQDRPNRQVAWGVVGAKLSRADEHLQAFHDELAAWGDSDPYKVTVDTNDQRTEYVYRLNYRTQPDLIRWGLIVGDCLHNMRGALDHLVYLLAIAASGKSPPPGEFRLAFPITNEPKYFNTSRIAALSDAAKRVIEDAQPHEGRNPMPPLWLLAQLNDIDKHRMLALMASAMDEPRIDIGPHRGGPWQVLANFGPLHDGAEFLKVIFTEPNPDVQMYAHPSVFVAFRDVPDLPRPALFYLSQMREEVKRICGELIATLP